MSVDIASLVFESDSTPGERAEKMMDRLIAAGERFDTTARKVKSASELAGIGQREMA